MSGSIQLKHWTTPRSRHRSSSRRRSAFRRDPPELLPHHIRIENARRIAVRVEMQERDRLIEVEMLGQPVERAGVIVLDVDRQTDLRRRAACAERERNEQKREPADHRAGLIFGFSASLPFNRTAEMQVSRAAVPRCTPLMTSFTVFTGSA